jgi:hypothetical protein
MILKWRGRLESLWRVAPCNGEGMMDGRLDVEDVVARRRKEGGE